MGSTDLDSRYQVVDGPTCDLAHQISDGSRPSVRLAGNAPGIGLGSGSVEYRGAIEPRLVAEVGNTVD